MCEYALLLHSAVVYENEDCKEHTLKIPLSLPRPGQPDLSLLPRCTSLLADTCKEGSKVEVIVRVGIARLLCVWLYECSNAVAAFIALPHNVPFVRSCVRGESRCIQRQPRANRCSRSTYRASKRNNNNNNNSLSRCSSNQWEACTWLASAPCCWESASSSAAMMLRPSMKPKRNLTCSSLSLILTLLRVARRTMLHDMITKRIGVDTFFAKLEATRKSSAFILAEQDRVRHQRHQRRFYCISSWLHGATDCYGGLEHADRFAPSDRARTV